MRPTLVRPWPALLSCVPLLASPVWAQPNREKVVDLSAIRARSIVVQTPTGSRTLSPAANRVSVLPWQYAAVRTGSSSTRLQLPAMRDAWRLPVVLATTDAAGTEYLLDIVVAAGNALMLRGGGDVFSGDIFVGVLDRKNPGAAAPLGVPVHILITGPVESIEPSNTVTVSRINQPFEKVSVRARGPGETIPLRFQPSFDTTASEVPIPVVRPHLVVSVTPQQVQGFGLETANITVRSEGLAEPADREVVLHASPGSFEPSSVVRLNQQGTATATFRSVGMARGVIVTAESAGLAPGVSGPIAFRLPVAFFLAAVVGSLAGSGIRAGTRPATARRRFTIVLAVGILTGVLIAVATAVGINVIGFEPRARAGEALVFAIAGLAAWLGMSKVLK